VSGAVVRDATAEDAVACAAIYAPYVRETAISFEAEPPDAAEMARRIANAQGRHAWLVAEVDGRVVGYAYAVRFKDRAAYDWSCEVSAYVEGEVRGGGLGRALYTELFARLTALGYRTAAAGATLPNAASTAFHLAMGFEPVGTWRRIGWKHGEWRDVAWFQRSLGDGDPDRPPTARVGD
jgi:phosphinothricin acetyltransferase